MAMVGSAHLQVGYSFSIVPGVRLTMEKDPGGLYLCHSSHLSLCLPISGGRRRFSSDPHHKNVVGFLEEETLQTGGPSDDWGPRCFSVTLVHTLPPAIRHNY